MPIETHIFGKDELIERFEQLPAQLIAGLTSEMKTQMVRLADYVRANKLSGDPLHRRTGRLSRSVSGQASASGTKIRGTIGSKGVPYARVHEEGGTFDIPSYSRMQTMVFGRPMIPKEVTVRAHTATYPQRAFLKPSLLENEDRIREALRARALEIMRASA